MAVRLVVIVVVCLWCETTHAQYFGQNKVQYERFAFQTLRTEHFDIYHYPAEAESVRVAARLAEEWRTRLSSLLGFGLPGRQPLVLYASHPHFTQTQVIDGLISEGTGGVTESLKRRMVLPFGSSLAETNHVLGHELVHAFQYAAGGERIGALPLWFIEGMAEFLSLGPDDAHTAMWLRDLAGRDDLPALDQLNDPRYFPYRIGHAVWAFLAARHGTRIVGATYLDAAQSGDPLGAIERTTGTAIADLSREWQAAIRAQHGSGSAATPPGRVVVSGGDGRRVTLNVAPALSPDGRWLAYLSERDAFSIDIYIAEAATGRVVRRLTSSDTDPHLESLQFIASAGAWDAASERFAYTTITRGKAALTVVNVAPRSGERTFALEQVDEAWHPTFAPDGRTIAFAALSGGWSDLHAIDLTSGVVRRLTSDAFADVQPAWSPDGRTLAFATDRFSSSLDTLSFGPLRPALLHLDGHAITPLASFPSGKHLNPQWDRAGAHLFLIAEPDGVPNVYRLEVERGTFARVTDVATGVTGITAGSPALSYAGQADRLAFSVLRRGGYDVRVLDAPGRVADGDLAPRPGAARSRLFESAAGTTTASLNLPGAAGRRTAPIDVSAVEPYRPALSLDLAGAGGGVGVSGRYGATFGGGLGVQFSDMLGTHNLGAYLSANGGVRDFGGQLLYVNRASRWNWGAAAMVLPYVSGALSRSIEPGPNGRVVVRDQEALFRQTDIELRGLVAYPFSRALRFELQAGGRRLGFGRELTTRVYDASSGELLDDQRDRLDAPAALTFAETAAALVYDQSVFGPTSPLSGQRYRFEVAPSLGSLRFTNVTLDYRRYLSFLRPFTLAVRGLHLARYGAGGEDPRLSALFLGYPALIRGYDAGSFDSAGDCDVNTGVCPEFEALFGSRLLLGNAELRFPLLGVFSREYRYGPLPIEGFAFADAGVAWTSGAQPRFAGGDRDVVRSAGAGLRVNAFGYAVVELALARPFDRARQGWLFSFNLRPGY